MVTQEVTAEEFLSLAERVVSLEAALMRVGITFYERTGPNTVALKTLPDGVEAVSGLYRGGVREKVA